MRVDACGICGTDIKKIQKGAAAPVPASSATRSRARWRGGAGVARFREGDRVVAPPPHPLRHLLLLPARRLRAVRDLQEERHHRRLRALRRRVRRVREGAATGSWSGGRSRSRTACPPEEAAFVEPVNTCLKAVRKAGVREGADRARGGPGAHRPPAHAALPVGGGRGAGLRHHARPAGDGRDAGRAGRPRRPRGRARARSGGSRTAAAPTARSWPRWAGRRSGRRLTPRDRRAVSWCSPPRPPERRPRWTWASLCAAEKEILTSYSSSVDVQDLAARLVFVREVRVGELVTHRFPLEPTPRGGRAGVAAGAGRAEGRPADRTGRRAR